MSITAKAIGTHTTKYEFEGVTYTLSTHTVEDYGAYELSLEEAGWAGLKRARHHKWINEQEYKENVREFLGLLSSFQLSFGSELYIKSTMTPLGVKKMMGLSLAHVHPEFKRDTLGEVAAEKLLDSMMMKDPSGVYEALGRLDPSPEDLDDSA
jgi:hypothetical protein